MVNKKVILKSGCKVRTIPKITIIAGIVFLTHIIFVSLGFFGLNKNILGNLFITLLSFLAFLSMFFIYKCFPSNFPVEKKAKLFLLISLFLFFIGDFSWLFEEVFLKNIVPIGSWPDLFWNIGYIALIFSAHFFIKTEFRTSKKLLTLLISIALIMAGTFLYFDLSQRLGSGILSFGNLIQDLYPVYDLTVFAMFLYLLLPLITTKNIYFLGWTFLGIGVLTRIVYDTAFIVTTRIGTYHTGHPIDLIYVLFYIFVILNSLQKDKMLNNKGVRNL